MALLPPAEGSVNFSDALTTALRRVHARPDPPRTASPEDLILRATAARLSQDACFPDIICDQPTWLTPSLRQALLEEALGLQSTAKLYSGHRRMVTGGRLAQACVLSPTLTAWIHTSCPVALRPGAATNYIYYAEGDYCPVHIDRRTGYQLNLLVSLAHQVRYQGDPSSLYIYAEESLVRTTLRAGETTLFSSSSLPHGRTALHPGESICLLSVGLQEKGGDSES